MTLKFSQWAEVRLQWLRDAQNLDFSWRSKSVSWLKSWVWVWMLINHLVINERNGKYWPWLLDHSYNPHKTECFFPEICTGLLQFVIAAVLWLWLRELKRNETNFWASPTLIYLCHLSFQPSDIYPEIKVKRLRKSLLYYSVCLMSFQSISLAGLQTWGLTLTSTDSYTSRIKETENSVKRREEWIKDRKVMKTKRVFLFLFESHTERCTENKTWS